MVIPSASVPHVSEDASRGWGVSSLGLWQPWAIFCVYALAGLLGDAPTGNHVCSQPVCVGMETICEDGKRGSLVGCMGLGKTV